MRQDKSNKKGVRWSPMGKKERRGIDQFVPEAEQRAQLIDDMTGPVPPMPPTPQKPTGSLQPVARFPNPRVLFTAVQPRSDEPSGGAPKPAQFNNN